MSVNENLTVAYHQQDTDYYCGAACAQMVLDQIGAGLLDQDGLYTDNNGNSLLETGWYTAPDGLQWTLNNRKPSTSANYFALYALDNEDAISRKIVWTIHHYHVAPVALVYGAGHWIVVRGFDADDFPSGPDDGSYAITAFQIDNPWPPTPATPPPPPHNASDGCGGGGVRGISNEHIAYSTWQSTYMTGVGSGYWNGKFVAVCDPEPPVEKGGRQAPTPKRLSGDRLLTKREAVESAKSAIRAYGLSEREGWNKSLANTKAGDPVLVQRLDRVDDFYYVVPMLKPKKPPSVLVSVDARFGDYRQAAMIPDASAEAFALLNFDPKKAVEAALGKRIELPNRKGRLVLRKEAFSLYPTLVWKPCRESLSPYYPFHMLTVGSHNIYIRVDGQVFTELHDQDRGI